MPQPPFDSHAQNGEDVVLWRALGHIPQGRYVDVGANDPTHESVTRAFYDHGWRGITVEPMPGYAAMHRDQRPGDLLVEAAVTSRPVETVTLHEIDGTGLSTLVDDVSTRHEADGYTVRDIVVPARRLDDVLADAGWAGLDIHFMTIDVEGAEAEVIASIDLTRWRPWVLVVEATAPLTTEPTHRAWEAGVLDADYSLCLFDGLSRFYVAAEHAAELGERLSYPATLLDNYSTNASRAAGAEITRLHDMVRDRDAEIARLQEALHELSEQHHVLSNAHHDTVQELTGMTGTLSWRLTRPLRSMRNHVHSRGHEAHPG